MTIAAGLLIRDLKLSPLEQNLVVGRDGRYAQPALVEHESAGGNVQRRILPRACNAVSRTSSAPGSSIA